MKIYKASLAIAVIAAGLVQVTQADTPTSAQIISDINALGGTPGPGLFLYDESTGASDFIAASGPSNDADTGGSIIIGNFSVKITAETLQGGRFPMLDLLASAAVLNDDATTLDVFYSSGVFGLTPIGSSYILSTTGPIIPDGVFTEAGASSGVFGDYSNLGGSTDIGGSDLTINAAGSSPDGNYYLTIHDAITGTGLFTHTQYSSVPEPTTVIAGALLLLPMGIGAVRSLRKA